MNPIVALSFLLISFINVSIQFDFKYAKSIAKIAGVFLLYVAFAKLFTLLTNIDLFVDKTFYGSQFDIATFRNPRQGMSSYALINLFIFGLHYLMFFSTNRKQKTTIVFLLVIAFFISLLNLLYHVFNATELTKVFGFYPMVGHAALCSTLLSALALLQNYPYGVMQDFSSPYLGGRFSRILSPIILIVPITFGFIKYYLTKEYNLSDEFGLVILIVILIILLYIVTNYLSSKLNQIHQSQTEFEQNYSQKLEKEIYQRTEELRINERKFQALIENSTDITILLNKDADLIYISPSFERMLGYTLEEIKSINTFELLHPDTMKETREEFNLMLQNPGVIYPSTQRIR
jgi:PAS domain-containing protein